MSPEEAFGYRAERSPRVVQQLGAEQLDALRAQKVGVLVTKEYVVREGGVIVKQVVLEKGVH